MDNDESKQNYKELKQIRKKISDYKSYRRNKQRLHEPISTRREFLYMNIASILIAMGISFFKYPNNFVIGGVSGMSVIFKPYLPFSAGSINLFLNLLLVVVGFFIFGKKFLLKTAYVSVVNSLTISLFEYLYPIDHPLTNEPFLELIIAVILQSVGSAILFNIQASSGGTDIIAMIIKKYTSFNIGTCLLVCDSIFTLLTIPIFGFTTGLLSSLGLFIKGFLVDGVIESINKVKYFTIITKKPKEIGEFIKKDLNRSATIMCGKGLYSGEERSIFLCAVSRYEAVLFRDYIKRIDPQ
ncbi:MAG: YitT family protein, partial [Tissierellia bacterium]|nr:YitT family protein [Tissierellia bacterium]